jgi:dTDP-L-rhamnose 4-epimerase
LIQHLDGAQTLQITHTYRAGDIRHCFADISHIQAMGYQPMAEFGDSIAELVEWVRSQRAVDDFERAQDELARRGLTN